MKYGTLVDMHTHSDNSFDGNQSCMMLCEKAFEKQLDAIAITDHCEIDSKIEDFRALCMNQFVETFECKRYFEGRLLVMQGIELGQAIYNTELANHILNKFSYDFVLGSMHNLKDMEDFFFLDYSKYDVNDLLSRYFDEMIKLCEWGQFDSLAHLTYPFRYIVGESKIDVDISKYDDQINTIFEILVKNKKALEINTSGLFQPLNDTLPNVELVKRFKKMGGEYITIGSDAHYADKIGQGLEQGLDIAKESGFDHITLYQSREPVQILIK